MTAFRGSEPGLVSVIVPCLGPLATTRPCLAALLRHSRRPWELIAVTRGGNDATSLYLAGVGDAAGVRVEIVGEPGLKGLGRGMVSGAASSARGVCSTRRAERDRDRRLDGTIRRLGQGRHGDRHGGAGKLGGDSEDGDGGSGHRSAPRTRRVCRAMAS